MIAWIGSFFDDHDDEMDKLKEVAIARETITSQLHKVHLLH